MGFSWLAFAFRYTEGCGSMAILEGGATGILTGSSDVIKALLSDKVLFTHIRSGASAYSSGVVPEIGATQSHHP